MRPFKQKKSFIPIVSLTLLSTIITACGGGDSSSVTNNTTPSEPMELTDSSWSKDSQNLSKSSKAISLTATLKKEGQNGQVTIMRVVTKGLTGNENHQVLLDIDNNPNTGYQHSIWSQHSGVDFIIENGALYESLSNNSDWSWKLLDDSIASTVGKDFISYQFNAKKFGSKLKKVCKKLNVGLVTLNDNWLIEQFTPSASKLLAQPTSYCPDTGANKAPVLNEKYTNRQADGFKEMYIPLGADPLQYMSQGITALDNEDGDVTHLITRAAFAPNGTPTSTINTSVATAPNEYYKVTYAVKDSLGIPSTQTKQRFFKVKANANNNPVFKYGDKTQLEAPKLEPITVFVGTNPATIKPTSPIVTVVDFEDGDIPSSKITFDRSHIDTSVVSNQGYITYKVKDSKGLFATMRRDVHVVSGKKIDGKKDDWSTFADVIDPFNHVSLYLDDDAANLYIMIEANQLGANTSIFIDSDNNANTDYRISEGNWSAGADLLIENTLAFSYAGKDYQWQWADLNNTVRIVRSGKIIEMSIPKSKLKKSNKNEVNIGFISSDANWSIRFSPLSHTYKFEN